MKKFPEETFDTLGYYVYRLIDPRDNKTFYVGKGKGNRVFAHVNGELKFAQKASDLDRTEDEISAKMQKIREIHNRKKDNIVKHVIHRYGMSEKEALEVESALIDVYSESGELTNLQSGHDAYRGMIDADDLIQQLCAVEYDEPDDIDYVIIKTKNSTVKNCDGSLYEASRKAWSLKLNKVKQIKYVLSTINGIVKEVYKVKEWSSAADENKVQFTADVAENNVRNIFIDKLLPQVYRRRGLASGALYKQQIDDEHILDLSDAEYDEPDNIDYVIVKTKNRTVEDCHGSLYEASRKAWKLKLDRVKTIKYVLSTINGIVKEVYKVDNWYSSDEEGRVEFTGKVAGAKVRNKFINKLLPQIYRKKGLAASALYKQQIDDDNDDHIQDLSDVEYDEPDDIDYVIVKTKNSTVENCDGSLYEASRKAWRFKLDRVKTIKYVLSTINGIVKEVYKVDNWYPSDEAGRVEFTGKVAIARIRNKFINKLLPKVYRKQGLASGALYKNTDH